LFCGDGGWLAAAKAINAIGQFLKDQGVCFGFGKYVIDLQQVDRYFDSFTLLTQSCLDLVLSRNLSLLQTESHAMELRP
jgi:hypothetical protein